jgi:anti-anti-sigma regulatory factor
MSKKQAVPFPPTISLGRTLGIREVGDLRAQFLSAIEAGPLVIDAGAVEQADSAGLQLLVALERSLAARGESVTYSATAPALHAAARLLGLHEACRLPAASGAANAG